MKITDLKCTVLGHNPVVRITTDEGIDGYGEVEASKPYLKPHVLFYKDLILGEDPTDVERVMLKIRRLGSFKPWGSAVSAIEMALWDIAGQGGRRAGLQAAGRQGARQGARLQRRGALSDGRALRPRTMPRTWRKMKAGPGEFQHHQAGHRLSQPDAPPGARLLLWRRRKRAACTPTAAR